MVYGLRTTPSPGLVKWWKYYTPIKGQVTRTISPYRQDVLTPLFKNMPANAVRRVKENIWDSGPPLAIAIGVIYWAQWKHDQIARSHRY